MSRALPRVVLDARPLSHPQAGGFRTYVRALVQGLGELPQKGANVVLYVDRPLTPAIAETLPPQMEVRVLHPSRLKTDFRLFRAQISRDAPDLIHGTMNYLPLGLPVPTTLTVHDAMGIKRYLWDAPLHQWTLRDRAINRYWAYLTRASALRARRVVTVSEGSKAELLSVLRVPPDRISVIYNGLTLRPPCDAPPRDANRVLVLAAPDSRKNLAVVCQAFGGKHHAALPRLDVVCTSDKTALRAEALLQTHGVENFRLLKGLDDAALARAYAEAGAFVWPSRMEGFGLPPLEAMRCGCPVVSSDAPAMPEVLGDIAVYFRPDKPGELAEKLAALLANPDDQADRSERGIAHAAAFTPRRMAEAHQAVWQSVAEGQGLS